MSKHKIRAVLMPTQKGSDMGRAAMQWPCGATVLAVGPVRLALFLECDGPAEYDGEYFTCDAKPVARIAQYDGSAWKEHEYIIDAADVDDEFEAVAWGVVWKNLAAHMATATATMAEA